MVFYVLNKIVAKQIQKGVIIHPSIFPCSVFTGRHVTPLKHLGFLDLPTANGGKICCPLAFAQNIAVTGCLPNLKPGVAFFPSRSKRFTREGLSDQASLIRRVHVFSWKAFFLHYFQEVFFKSPLLSEPEHLLLEFQALLYHDETLRFVLSSCSISEFRWSYKFLILL